ncbi:MAG: toprim domain-containing protein [Pseudomonadota bacterium]|uniref:Virulence-associated protein E n=1 Tax=Phenylobacterium kunshanense TaxID=1445034 RepID=A0A328BPJ7_9CAUL|nr:toprim domain-containing protein [Phenylobacterium kunshanense]PZQ60357.1 MAG: virulence-associated protein E [Phenylobacterium zucineum]RAK67916.1 virulence-associated protein E [Phenylobacterium kunshanense]
MTSKIRSGGTLAALVCAYGGDLYAGGRRALVPAPGHSPQDRSVSLLLQDGRVIAHGFGGADWREVLDDLRDRGWIDGENRLLEGGVPLPEGGFRAAAPTRAERTPAAVRLWREGGPIRAGSPAALYAAARGVDLALADGDALRAHAAAPAFAYADRGPRRPALLAAVCDPTGALTAVEITYLDGLGRRRAAGRLSRKTIGAVPAGSAVRLAGPGPAMLVGEGVFTTLSAMRRFAVPGWALLSTGNLRRWRPPPGVRHVLIAGDRGADGERSAAVLQAALSETGVFAEVALPPAGYGDWNDLDQEKAEEGRTGAPGS